MLIELLWEDFRREPEARQLFQGKKKTFLHPYTLRTPIHPNFTQSCQGLAELF